MPVLIFNAAASSLLLSSVLYFSSNFRKDETILEHLQNLQSGNGHSAPQSGNGHSAPQSGNGHSAPQSGNGHSAPQSGNGHSAPHSHSMKCGSTRCVFHMSAYQYEKETQV